MHVVASSRRTQLWGTGNVVGKPDASRAMYAPVHRGLDQRSNVLVFHSAFASHLVESSPIRTISHRLILQITLASLIADGAVEGMVGKEKLHDAFSGFVGKRRVGLDDHAWLNGPCA